MISFFCIVYVLKNNRDLDNDYFENNSMELISLVNLYGGGELGYKMYTTWFRLVSCELNVD